MNVRAKIGLILAAVAIVFCAGYFTKAYRTSNEIAGYNARELQREEEKRQYWLSRTSCVDKQSPA